MVKGTGAAFVLSWPSSPRSDLLRPRAGTWRFLIGLSLVNAGTFVYLAVRVTPRGSEVTGGVVGRVRSYPPEAAFEFALPGVEHHPRLLKPLGP